ncbi:hypothetical protein ABQD58_12670, partial [Lactococcus lactis]
GLFFYTQKGSIISMVDLPTTEIIEPHILSIKKNQKKPIDINWFLLMPKINYTNYRLFEFY